jgi:hypothetical protein
MIVPHTPAADSCGGQGEALGAIPRPAGFHGYAIETAGPSQDRGVEQHLVFAVATTMTPSWLPRPSRQFRKCGVGRPIGSQWPAGGLTVLVDARAFRQHSTIFGVAKCSQVLCAK